MLRGTSLELQNIKVKRRLKSNLMQTSLLIGKSLKNSDMFELQTLLTSDLELESTSPYFFSKL